MLDPREAALHESPIPFLISILFDWFGYYFFEEVVLAECGPRPLLPE